MRIQAPVPFEEYKAYKIFHRKMGRWLVCLVPLDGGKRTTILYSKFVMSISLGRILTRDEEVDHVDGDKTNDALANLEVVTRRENRRRYDMANPGKVLRLKCAYCGCSFSRRRNQTSYSKPGQMADYCSRRCVGLMNLGIPFQGKAHHVLFDQT